jgi:hypothetical protein
VYNASEAYVGDIRSRNTKYNASEAYVGDIRSRNTNFRSITVLPIN